MNHSISKTLFTVGACVFVISVATVLPAKSDSVAYKVIREMESIDHLFINPIRSIGLIHK